MYPRNCFVCVSSRIYIYIYIWVILMKTGKNFDIEGKNSKCEFINVIIWK